MQERRIESLRQRWFCRTEAVFLRTGICFLSVSRCRNSQNWCELCGIWTPNPPSISHALAGASVLVNLSASNELTGKEQLPQGTGKWPVCTSSCGIYFASAGEGESTHRIWCLEAQHHCGKRTDSCGIKRFGHGILYSEIDVERLCAQRRRMTTFVTEDQTHTEILFSLKK